MTPKEKAKELVEKHKSFIDWNTVAMPHIKNMVAKQCALICVDEILEFDLRFFDIEFLKEVKLEINKL